MRLTPDEMLADVERRLAIPRWNMNFKSHDWFFPNDVAPHSSKFKYMCKKLHGLGMLERNGGGSNRWGYTYRVPEGN